MYSILIFVKFKLSFNTVVEYCDFGCDTGEDICYECTTDSHCSSGYMCSGNKCVLEPIYITCYRDSDEDNYGNPSYSRQFEGSCGSYNGYDYVSNNNDCDDTKSYINPKTDWYLDSDNDNYAYDLNSAQIYNQCNRPTNHKLWNELESVEDCNDNNPNLNINCEIPIEEDNELCTDNFQVIVEDNTGAGLEDVTITESKQSRTKISDSLGQATFSYTNINCHEDITFSATCSDSTICGTKKDDIDDNFDSITFDCSVCVPDKEDLSFDRNTLKITENIISVNISSIGITNSNVKITLYLQDETGLRDENGILTKTISITANQDKQVSFTGLDLSDIEFIHLYIDEKNSISEENEDNNYIFSAVNKNQNVYVEVDFGSSFSILNNLTKDYLDSYFNVVDDVTDADYVVVIGESAILKYKNLNDLILRKQIKKFKEENDYSKSIGFIETEVIYDNINNQYKPRIYVYGYYPQSIVAGVKRLINAKDMYFSMNNYYDSDSIPDKFYGDTLDKDDKLGLQIMDLLSYDRLGDHLRANDEVLRRAVEDVYYDNNLEVSIKPVKTLSSTSYNRETQLRTKNLNIDFSQKYKDAFGIYDTPVVMAGGIYSNIDAFEDFGRELVEEGHNVYLIEITGGPDQEDNTPYTYEDLEDYYVPALIAGVQHYSGSNTINYIGHSNGCRSALTSLSKYYSGENDIGYIFNYQTGAWELVDLKANPVDKFFGIACPTTLNDLEWTSKKLREIENGESVGTSAIQNLRTGGIINVEQEQYFIKIDGEFKGTITGGNNKISLNLQEFYTKLYLDENSLFGANQNVANKYIFFAGTDNYIFFKDYGGDGVVPLQDLELLNNNFQNSELHKIDEDHTAIANDYEVIKIVKEKLK